ncbi:MAG: hypothetical protein WAT19_15430 [Ferruginibacter sp.]
MKYKLFLFLLCSILFSGMANAQLGGLLKKKKDKTEQPADSTSRAAGEEEEKSEKKKGGGFFQKVVGKIAKTAGGLVATGTGAIGTVDNLEDADVVVAVGTNIYSKDLGLMLPDFIGKEWVNNGDFTMLQLASKDAFKMYKYSGTIKVNDKELKHFAMGIHSATENPNSGVKKIVFEKAGSVEGSFEVPVPAKNVKLISVNGQTKNIKVDFTKDVVIEMANYTTSPESLIRVDVVTTQIGIRTLSLVAYVKPAAKVIIPAAAFRNIENDNKYNFKNCYLAIADQVMVKAGNIKGKIPDAQMVSTGSNDGLWIEVTNSSDNNKGIKFENGNATVEKKNASRAMPLSFAKNIAASSFYVYGETYTSGTTENRLQNTRTTKTIDFPDVPNEVLDAGLKALYNNLTIALTEVLGSKMMPVGTVPTAPSYVNTMKFMSDDLNNSSEFLRAYEGLSPIKGLSSVSNRYYGENALIKDTRADALLKTALIFRLSWDEKPMITPYLHIELVGESNGDFRSYTGSTKYFSMDIKGAGYELKKKMLIDYDKMFQVKSLADQFKSALAELKAKEQANNDYELIWNLQR